MNSIFPILVLNPGSTSTKLALYHNETLVTSQTIAHSAEELQTFNTVWEQYPFRLDACKRWVTQQQQSLAAVVGIGGLLRSVEGGTYRINQRMLEDAKNNLQGEHASNLGCALAFEFAHEFQCPSFIVDPVSVDEFEPLAHYSGHPSIERKSLSHSLNIHAVVRLVACEMGLDFSTSIFIVCHLGGGISIAPVRFGRIIDVNDAASDGPFSPERTGGLPLQQFISLCYSKKFSEQEMRKLVMGNGGLYAYTGTTNAEEIEKRALNDDKKAKEIFEAMAYQIAKEIGAMATVVKGDVNAIVLTGGLAKSALLTTFITDRVRFIAPIKIFPGEDEMKSLALGALRVLQNKEKVKDY